MKLYVNNLSFSFKGEEKLFNGINFTISNGDVLNIIGTNGTGKTTFANCMINFQNNYTGNIMFDNTNSKSISINNRAEYIGYVGMNYNSYSSLNVLDYVLLGTGRLCSLFYTPKVEEKNKVKNILEELNILNLENKQFSNLSNGEKQLVAIARLIIQDPQIIILDEPTAFLDIGRQKEVIDVIKKLSADGKIIINITHNPEHAFKLGGYTLMMFRDSYIYGKNNDILSEKNLSNLYSTKIKIIESEQGDKLITTC